MSAPAKALTRVASTKRKAMLDLGENLSYRLSMLGFLLGRATSEIYGSEGLTAHQWKVISVVCHFAPTRASQIERLVTLDKSAVSRALQSLVAAGLVERLPAADDGRAVDVVPSRRGSELHARVANKMMELQEALLGGLPTANVQNLFKTIHQLEARLRAGREPPVAP